jgi:hypothetical protein
MPVTRSRRSSEDHRNQSGDGEGTFANNDEEVGVVPGIVSLVQFVRTRFCVLDFSRQFSERSALI